MSLHSMLHKISRATDPTRFVEPGKTAPSVWSSVTRVVEEKFERTLINEQAGHVSYERRAVASEIGRPGAEIKLSIKREVLAGKDLWFVSLQDCGKEILAREGEASEMIALYKKLYASLTPARAHAGAFRLVMGAFAGLVAIYLGLAAIGGLVDQRAEQQAQALPTYGQMPGYAMPGALPPAAIQPAAAQSGSTDTQLTDEERKIIGKRASRISLGGSGAEMLVFTDPNCPFCQRLEPELEELVAKNEGKVTIIPVAFKDGSREALAAAFCSKDPLASWKVAVAGGQVQGKVCDAGLKKVDENNKLFTELKFAATPTLITPKGLILASYANVEQLRQLIKL